MKLNEYLIKEEQEYTTECQELFDGLGEQQFYETYNDQDALLFPGWPQRDLFLEGLLKCASAEAVLDYAWQAVPESGGPMPAYGRLFLDVCLKLAEFESWKAVLTEFFCRYQGRGLVQTSSVCGDTDQAP